MNACIEQHPSPTLPSLARRLRARVSGAWLASLTLTLTALGAGVPVTASAELRPERFDAQTWSVLRSELRRPALVVFTTTHCPTCPEVLARVAEMRARQLPGAPLVAVVMDGQEAAQAQPAGRVTHSLTGVDRLFHFQGSQPALRYSVDPTWRGVTPYVVLLPALGPAMFSAGSPSELQWAAWASSASPAASSRR